MAVTNQVGILLTQYLDEIFKALSNNKAITSEQWSALRNKDDFKTGCELLGLKNIVSVKDDTTVAIKLPSTNDTVAGIELIIGVLNDPHLQNDELKKTLRSFKSFLSEHLPARRRPPMSQTEVEALCNKMVDIVELVIQTPENKPYTKGYISSLIKWILGD